MRKGPGGLRDHPSERLLLGMTALENESPEKYPAEI